MSEIAAKYIYEKRLLVLDLFSGIGGFSLGLERTGGFKTIAFCEWDEKAQLVLKKHWPDVPVAGDIKKLTVAKPIDAKDRPINYVELWYDGVLIYTGLIHVITGGFPCQDISCAGNQCGLQGERSGHFFEIIRLAGAIRPDFIIMENVSRLLTISDGRDFGTVLTKLDSIGFDAEWHCIPAAYVGAPHLRDRIWFIAHPSKIRRGEDELNLWWREHDAAGGCTSLAHPNNNGLSHGQDEIIPSERREQKECHSIAGSQDVADTTSKGLETQHDRRNTPKESNRIVQRSKFAGTHAEAGQHWGVEPAVGRVADGVPRRVDRLKQLGNSVVPQIPEMLGYAILESR